MISVETLPVGAPLASIQYEYVPSRRVAPGTVILDEVDAMTSVLPPRARLRRNDEPSTFAWTRRSGITLWYETRHVRPSASMSFGGLAFGSARVPLSRTTAIRPLATAPPSPRPAVQRRRYDHAPCSTRRFAASLPALTRGVRNRPSRSSSTIPPAAQLPPNTNCTAVGGRGSCTVSVSPA